MFNRLPLHYFIPARKPSVADKILRNIHGLKLELLRGAFDDGEPETFASFEIHGTLPDDGDAAALLAAVLREFRTPQSGESEGVE